MNVVVRIVADGPCEPGGLLLLLHLKEVMQLSGNGNRSTRMKHDVPICNDLLVCPSY